MQVTPNFTLNLAKLDDQYDTKNIPSLISVVSADSKTLGHRMGAFQGALQVLQSIVLEMQGQGGIGAIAGKQLSVILDQVHTQQTSFLLQQPTYCRGRNSTSPVLACSEIHVLQKLHLKNCFIRGGWQRNHPRPARSDRFL